LTSSSFLHLPIRISRVFPCYKNVKTLDPTISIYRISGTHLRQFPRSLESIARIHLEFYPQQHRPVIAVMKKSNLEPPASNESTAQQRGFPVTTPDPQPLDSATARQPLLDSTSSCTRTRTRIPKTQIEVLFRPDSRLFQSAMVRETVIGQAKSGERSSIQKSSIADVKGRISKIESGLEVLLVLGRGARQRTRPSRGPNSQASPRFPARKVQIIMAGDWQAQVKRARPMENPSRLPDGPNPEESLPARNALLSLPGAPYNRGNPSPGWRLHKDQIRNALLGPRLVSAAD
jgi:hypothetical protein